MLLDRHYFSKNYIVTMEFHCILLGGILFLIHPGKGKEHNFQIDGSQSIVVTQSKLNFKVNMNYEDSTLKKTASSPQ